MFKPNCSHYVQTNIVKVNFARLGGRLAVALRAFVPRPQFCVPAAAGGKMEREAARRGI